jgi:RND family efflux transporter MFP subunit
MIEEQSTEQAAHGHPPDPGARPPKRFSKRKPIIVAILVIAAFSVLIVMALRPRKEREREVMEQLERNQGVPTVLVSTARVVPARGELLLPGSIQALADAPIFSRAEGYLSKRLVDIGDRVSAGQLLATIEAPEVDKQVQQAEAAVSRNQAALAQAEAALKQSDAQLKLAEVTAQRWNTLVQRRVVSRQEADEKQAAFDARRADNDAARANVAVARDAVRASQADLQRLKDLKGFQEIRAPFAGIITARNTEVGSLIRGGASEGKELYRLARIDRVRIMVNVPQINVPQINVGDSAVVRVDERPNRLFGGKIVRTASSLEPATRTLLTEIHVANPDAALLPGMYAEVRFAKARSAPAVLIQGDTLVVRSDGPQVAVVGDDGTVRYRKVTLGRDYGAEIEISSGLQGGESLVANPGDETTEGAVVKVKRAKETAPTTRPSK